MKRYLFILSILLFCIVQSYGRLVYKGQVKDSVGGAEGLWGAQCVAVSHDGRHVYAAGSWDDAVSWFVRDTGTGNCSFGGQVKDGEGGADGLKRARALAFGPEDKQLYVTATGDTSVAWFNRNLQTGALSFGGVLKNGMNGVSGLDQPHSITLSRDGKDCYITGAIENTITWFNRNTLDGSLSFAGLLKDGLNGVDGLLGAYSVCMSGDDNSVYVASSMDNAVAWFTRTPASGALSYGGIIKSTMANVNGLRGPASVMVSPNGGTVYCASATSDALVWFTRNKISGALTYAGCFQDSSIGATDTYGMNGAFSVAVSPNGSALYVAARWSNAVTWFSLDTANGNATFKGTIKDISGLTDAKWVAVDAQGEQVFVAATTDNAVAWFDVEPESVASLPVASGTDSHASLRLSRILGAVEIWYTLPPKAQQWGGITIRSINGKMVRTLVSAGRSKSGIYRYVWDLRSNSGKPVAPGTYLCVVDCGMGRKIVRPITIEK